MPHRDHRRILETVRDESYRLHMRAQRALFTLEYGHTAPTKEAVDRMVSEAARWEWAQQVAESMVATAKAEERRLSGVDRVRSWVAAFWR